MVEMAQSRFAELLPMTRYDAALLIMWKVENMYTAHVRFYR